MHKSITRLYTGSDGRSHFADAEVQLDIKVKIGTKLESLEPTGITVWEKPPHHDHDRHNAPRRLFLIALEGETEMEVGDGTKRRFKPGDILLVEDTAGEGHVTRALGDKGRKAVIVTLD